ncbi:hypothetical protein [Clostridium sp. DJ247]|uniref:hypothetical protein n=1 Tax=Clostridium sp. DJ247 TaxID=2726188 RepID=UPI0016242482|nr:hypothetical protein [Clostridium sp. DJ247]MBC2581213.1 hypothetical protein [Clostridium sp. DJ247]
MEEKITFTKNKEPSIFYPKQFIEYLISIFLCIFIVIPVVCLPLAAAIIENEMILDSLLVFPLALFLLTPIIISCYFLIIIVAFKIKRIYIELTPDNLIFRGPFGIQILDIMCIESICKSQGYRELFGYVVIKERLGCLKATPKTLRIPLGCFSDRDISMIIKAIKEKNSSIHIENLYN